MTGPFPVLLFDVDGVLVEPRGYRQAVLETLAHFTRRMGFDNASLPAENDLAFLESRRITSEWDMVPLCLAAVLESFAERFFLPRLPADLDAACRALAAFLDGNSPAFRVDYRTPVERLAAALQPGEYPADAVLRLARKDLAAEGFPFPHLFSNPLTQNLFANTRAVAASPTTRLFQQIALGSQTYSQTYGLPAEIVSRGALQEYDRPLLAPAWRARLLAEQAAGRLAFSAFTMRPSRPPREINQPLPGYPPEAEMALTLAGWAEIPLIGYGRVVYYAQQAGVPPETLLKPAPVQALAAALAALNYTELPSLATAHRLYVGSEKNLPAVLERRAVTLHAFEDSPGGLDAARLAVQLLVRLGARIDLHLHGISADPEKRERLAAVGASVSPDVNAALASLPFFLDKSAESVL